MPVKMTPVQNSTAVAGRRRKGVLALWETLSVLALAVTVVVATGSSAAAGEPDAAVPGVAVHADLGLNFLHFHPECWVCME